ncbi:MAG: hypothetical protein ACTSUE_18605 [Promethearchaeota archaeon]
MKLQIEYPKKATIGQPFSVSAKIVVEGESIISYSGVKLSAIRPCERELLIDQREIFCKGEFSSGEYRRSVVLPLSAKIIPTSEKRGIKYKVDLYARISSESGDQELKEDGEIVLVEARDARKVLEVDPVVLAIKGLKINLQKDTFRPGETIKINYQASELRDLKVLLMQRSNILCKCTQYGRVCTKVPVIPPSAAGAAKASNPTTGFLLLPVPRNAELTNRHNWEPKEKSTWNDKFGDYNEWYLAISGRKYNNEDVHFEIPIEIDQGIIGSEKPPDVQFFEAPGGDLDSQEERRVLFQQKKLEVHEVKKDGEGVVIKVFNGGDNDFSGCTCKVTGIKDMFFETPPIMAGVGEIASKSEKIIHITSLTRGVSEINMEFVSNEGKLGTFKKAI